MVCVKRLELFRASKKLRRNTGQKNRVHITPAPADGEDPDVSLSISGETRDHVCRLAKSEKDDAFSF